MFLLAQIIGLIGVIVNIVSIQLKNKKNILMLFLIANVLFGITFFLLKSYTGSVICLIAAIQTYINNIFVNNGKVLPKKLIILFILISAIAGFLSYKSIVDIMPVMSSVLYIFSIVQSNEKNIRLLTFLNMLLWSVFDIVVGAYTASISDIIFLISTIVAIYRYDILK